MALAIIKTSLVSVISYNKFNHFQKTDSECKNQELKVTGAVFFSEIFGGFLKTQR